MVFVAVVVVNFYFLFVGVTRLGEDMEGLENEQNWGVWCEIPKESVKNIMLKNKMNKYLEGSLTT